MTRVVYAAKARRDVIRIVEKIAVEDPNAATKFALRVEHRCSLLARSPAMGRKRPDIGIGVRSLVEGSHLIFYRWSIDDGVVEILHVRHGRRQLPRLRG